MTTAGHSNIMDAADINSWFCMTFGFSWIGALFLTLLFIPNILFGLHLPAGFQKISSMEKPVLVFLERTGQILVCFLLLFSQDLRWSAWSSRSWYLVLAAVLMLLNTYWWIRYFSGSRTLQAFFRPLWGLPIPAAILPVAACFLLALYSQNAWLLLATIILGIGHIGIHLQHLQTIRQNP